MQVNVLDTKGKVTGKITLPDEIFSQKANNSLLAQAARVYLANLRKSTAKVKTRGEVRGSRRKIWRQKGTGRARHGDRYAPIFVGGGIAHGPSPTKQYKLKLSKKMRRKALFVALSEKLRDKGMLVVDGLEKLEPKTKIMVTTLEKVIKKPWKKITIITPDKAEAIARGIKNIKKVHLQSAKRLNAYQILNAGQILITKNAAKALPETYLSKTNQTQVKRESRLKKKVKKKTANHKAQKTRLSK